MPALFDRYPQLKDKLSYVSFGDFPTPVEKLEDLGQALHVPALYAKREDLSGQVYGGNKVRALEFLLGDVLRSGRKRVLALGFPASCQALAQAIYARQLGIHSLAILFPQVSSKQARQHLLMYLSIQAELYPLGLPALLKLLQYRLRDGVFPKLLEASSPLGMVGYVSAAFELKGQIEQGLLPEPDLIYVGLATMGTAGGLALGCKAAGLKSRVVGVHLGNSRATPRALVKLMEETNTLITSADMAFPRIPASENDVEIRYGFAGSKDRLLSEAGARARQQTAALANLQLDEMFAANAFAALLADAATGLLHDKTVLWWNSYNSRAFTGQPHSLDYHQLPQGFQRYFAEEPR